jgi:diguanylate cyclase (GGDEF)-like protein/PAS domain S-box-containing protein
MKRAQQHTFLREVTGQLYLSSISTVMVGAIVAALLTFVLWEDVGGGPAMAGWLALIEAVYLGRYVLARAFFRAAPGDAKTWLIRFRTAVALQGALWGGAAFLLFPSGNALSETAFLFAIAGLAGGAAIAFGIDIGSVLWFEIPLAAPLLTRMFSLGTPEFAGMGVMVLMYMAYVSVVLPRSAATSRENLRLRLAAARREAEIRERNALLNSILENEPECVKIVGLDGALTLMNKAGLAMLEVGSLEEANQTGLINFVHPNHRQAFQALFDRVCQGVSGQLEFQVIGRRGTVRWLETNATPLHNAAGEISGMLGVTRNVTARKQADLALQKSEQRYRTLSTGTFEGVVLTANGRIVDLNDQFARMLGYTREEMLRRPMLDFVAPADRPMAEAAIRSGQERTAEAALLHRDGSRVLVEGHGQTYEQDGAPMRLTALRDITSRKQAEARLAESRRLLDSVVEHIPSMLFLKDAETLRFVMLNRAAEALLGHTREEMLGKNDYDFFPREQADFFTRSDRQVLDARLPDARVPDAGGGDKSAGMLDISEEAIDTPAGMRVLHTRKIALRDEAGKPRYLLGISEDVTERRQQERALRESEEKLRRLYELAPLGIALTDMNGRYVEFNEAFREICGYSEEELKALDYWMLTPIKYEAEEARQLDDLRKTGRYGPYEKEYQRKDGTLVPLRLNGVLVTGRDGRQYIWSIVENITGRREAEREVRIAATAFESQEGMIITDEQGSILRVNKAFTDITGYAIEDVAGRNPRMLSSGRHDKRFFQAMWKSIIETGSWSGEVWNRRKDGQVFPEHLSITSVKDASGKVINYVGSLTDITQRKASEEEIQRLAFYDHLTGLPNRRLFMDRLKQSIAGASRARRTGALLFIDMDNFKNLNDTLGHDYGDMLLQQVGLRLSAAVREGDTVARLGGDEFVVLLESVGASAPDAVPVVEMVGKKIQEVLGQPYDLAGTRYASSPSIGVTLVNGVHGDAESLLKQADIAMYQAKRSGRNTLRFFDQHMQEAINRRAALETDLRSALEQNQILLYFQVQKTSQDKPVGAEVLVRWKHPERGMISPAEFIPLAEETGIILPLGWMMIDQACARLKTWEANPRTRTLSLAVNVSARQFHQDGFAGEVAATIRRHGINPGRLKLELTESLVLQNIEETVDTMTALNHIGVQIALDDFGTGYSSLQYLKRLPLDQLKIDQSFVRDLGQNTSALAIVQTIIAMADSMGLDIIAEGVETEQQRRILQRSGCTHFQGYLFGMPVPLEQFEAALAAPPGAV